MYVAQKLNLAVETRSSKLGFETSKSRETDDGWVSLILTRGRPGDFHLGKEGRKVFLVSSHIVSPGSSGGKKEKAASAYGSRGWLDMYDG